MSEVMQELRSKLGDDSVNLSDNDCLRFLQAKKGHVENAVNAINACKLWRETELPGRQPGVTPNNILITTQDCNLCNHEQKELIPFLLDGRDKCGRPLYIDKTGVVSSHYSDVKKHFPVDDTVKFHIRTQEMMSLRLENLSKSSETPITQWIRIYDMACVSMAPDFDSLQHMRRTISIDQEYYPGRLFKLYIINAPWYFTAIFALVKPFINSETAKLYQILGADYLPALLEDIDEAQLPVCYGGTRMESPWNGPWSEDSGCSDSQIFARFGTVQSS